jgi:dTMP kinase
MTGFFITFEGIDGCGKSVQTRLLAEKLRTIGKEILLLREPGTTPISEAIREILLNLKHQNMAESTELLLFAAARAQIVSETILPALAAGKMVLCDRFYDSTTAYQGFGREINLDVVRQINRFAVQNKKPDLTIVLDLTPEIAKTRLIGASKKLDRMETSGDEFMHRVRQGFLQIAREEPERVVVIAGDQSIGQIAKQIWQILSDRLHF